MILLGSFPVLSVSCGVSVLGSRGLAVGQYVYMEVEDSYLRTSVEESYVKITHSV